ncbi:MAG: iron-containing alcohol dehydrogenase [Pseudomonadota bacterium]
MYKLYCRCYQGILRLASYFLPWRRPELISGVNCINRLPSFIKGHGLDKVLLITDRGIASLGLADGLISGLRDECVDCIVYDKTVPNPTIDNIEEALLLYRSGGCKGIIAFGGGSSMDCAKGVGARVARSDKSIPRMKGLFKVMRRIPPLFAIPTTAGTGSEATVAAVITNTATHEKYPINDTSLIPHYAIHDPMLTIGLPPHITATTGIDALTHAIEAYIGRSNTSETRELSREAVRLIFENLPKAYSDGNDIEARGNMQKAAYYAGIAFTRAYVGYVHAVAHTLGGFYGVPHGLANAVILPYVLLYYGESAHRPLSELAELIGIGEPSDSMAVKANSFIERIRQLNKDMNIPDKISGINENDIPQMAERAFAEGNPLYPVPRILLKEDLSRIYNMIKE